MDGPGDGKDGKALQSDRWMANGIIDGMPLGIYISVPFCRTKCSYCNFASDVFSRAVFAHYVDRVCVDLGKGLRRSTEKPLNQIPRQRLQ